MDEKTIQETYWEHFAAFSEAVIGESFTEEEKFFTG